MGRPSQSARVLDAGALIAIDRGDARLRDLLRDPRQHIVPAGVVAQVWRDPTRQARLAAFLSSDRAVVEPLDKSAAEAVGAILGRAGTADVVDASVVVSARRHGAIVLSSDPEDMRRIDPSLEVWRV